MLTVAEAAKRACVREDVVRHWIETGRLRYEQIDCVTYVAVEELDGFLGAARREGVEP